MALLIDEDITEEIVVGCRVSLEKVGLLGGNIKTEKTISGCSYKQMVFIFLKDIVDSWNILCAIHLNMDKQIVSIIIKIKSFLGSYPQVSF